MALDVCLQGLVLDMPVYLSAVTMAGLIVLWVWIVRHEEFFGQRHFLATVIGMILWLAAATFEMATPHLACKVAAATAAWPGIALVPISWSLFMWQYCFSVPPEKLPHSETAVAMLVGLVTILAMSNPLHGLFYGPDTALVFKAGRPSLQVDHGPLFYVVALLLYAFLIAGFAISGKAAFLASRSLRPMMFILMFATAVPMVSNFAYVVMDATLFGFDTTPFAFSFVLLALTWAVFANRGLDLVSIARDLLYFNLADPVLVVNARGVVMGANEAARDIMPNVSRIGGPLSGERSFDLIRRVIGSRECWTAQGDISFGERTYNMRVLPIPTPLRETGGHLGAVAILSDITQIQVKNRQFAEALDRSRAQVAEISRLRDIAEHASMIDPLTRVANRRALTTRVDGLGDVPFAMALIDLDHFKQINDRFGHAVGDRILRDFAAAGCTVLPPEADLFRVGGEEFVLLLVGKPLSDMLSLLGAVKAAMADGMALRENDDERITFSAGVAARPRDGETFEELFARADVRLYQAKRSGRDRVMHLDSVSVDAVPPDGSYGKTGSGTLE